MALRNSGLIHPDDLELERILAEDWDSVPDQEIPETTLDDALNQFLYGDDEESSIPGEPEQEANTAAEEAIILEAFPEKVSDEAELTEEAITAEVLAETGELVSAAAGSDVVYLDTEEEDEVAPQQAEIEPEQEEEELLTRRREPIIYRRLFFWGFMLRAEADAGRKKSIR